MKDKIEKAIEELVNKSKSANDGGEALKLTQSALNLAHAFQVWKQTTGS